MAYDPYAAEDKLNAEAKDLLRRINLPEGWAARCESGLRALLRYDPKAARKLAQAIKELGDAYAERGKVISDYVKGVETTDGD